MCSEGRLTLSEENLLMLTRGLKVAPELLNIPILLMR